MFRVFHHCFLQYIFFLILAQFIFKYTYLVLKEFILSHRAFVRCLELLMRLNRFLVVFQVRQRILLDLGDLLFQLADVVVLDLKLLLHRLLIFYILLLQFLQMQVFFEQSFRRPAGRLGRV
ncbi:Hypothetical_protein [Hexamita inflata]|uniref:Hypothetical_protein n=1 Tax=Hexamita inflata TaxID=28002 RepID=A0ABP1IKL4_9EUKA